MSTIFDAKLNRDTPIPLYYQLKEILFKYITETHDDPQKPIPTELELSGNFGVSRPTVRQAINELVTEGHLYRQKGKGTFVSKPKISQQFLQSVESFNVEMQRKGMTPSTRVLEISTMKSNPKVSEALQIPLDSDVIQLGRLRYANHEPIVFVTTYLPLDKCKPLLSQDFVNHSLYELLETKCSLALDKVVRSLEAVVAGEYEAELLNIDLGTAVQFIETTAYLSNGTPIEYSLAKYRGDRNKFTYEFSVSRR